MIPPASPEFMMGGPPPQPGGPPRPGGGLSSLPMGGPAGEDSGGGIAKLVFSLEQALKTLGKAVPSAAEEIGQISQLLRSVLMKASGGAKQGQEAMQPTGGFAAKPVI